jgi:hypothetical protein
MFNSSNINNIEPKKLYLSDYKTVPVQKGGYTLKLPQLSADLLQVGENISAKSKVMTPLNTSVTGNKLSILA